MTLCVVLRPNPNKCPSSHCLRDPLCTTASFPPALCRAFPSSFTPEERRFPIFPYFNANRLAVKARDSASEGRTASTVPVCPCAPARGGQSRRGWFQSAGTATWRWLDASANSSTGWCLRKNALTPSKKQAMQCPRGSGEGKSEGISPVVVFSECQFELHCIHQEVVEIMGNNGSPGLWTKSPWNNGSPSMWTVAGAP